MNAHNNKILQINYGFNNLSIYLRLFSLARRILYFNKVNLKNCPHRLLKLMLKNKIIVLDKILSCLRSKIVRIKYYKKVKIKMRIN